MLHNHIEQKWLTSLHASHVHKFTLMIVNYAGIIEEVQKNISCVSDILLHLITRKKNHPSSTAYKALSNIFREVEQNITDSKAEK